MVRKTTPPRGVRKDIHNIEACLYLKAIRENFWTKKTFQTRLCCIHTNAFTEVINNFRPSSTLSNTVIGVHRHPLQLKNRDCLDKPTFFYNYVQDGTAVLGSKMCETSVRSVYLVPFSKYSENCLPSLYSKIYMFYRIYLLVIYELLALR